MVGVKPKSEGGFERVLRIFDQKGFYITFNEGQIHQLFSTLREKIPIDGKRVALERVSEICDKENVISVVKAKYGSDLWEIGNEKSDSLLKMGFGGNTLQRLIQLDNLIIFAFNSKDYVYAQFAFTSMVESVQKMLAHDRMDSNRIQKYLLDTAKDRYEFGESSPFYTIARETLANFKDFFLYMINNP